jgi:hypothetical protein
MASLRNQRVVLTSATIVRIVTLLSFLQGLLLASLGGGEIARSAHAGLRGSVSLLEQVDCVASSHHDDAPSPACPRHTHCCLLGSPIASPPDLFRAIVLLRPESGEAETIGLAAEEGDRGPDPAPPWASRAPPPSA